MGNGFQFLDIILLAMVAGFLVFRLRSVLGRRTGHEPAPRPEDRFRTDAAETAAQEAGERAGNDNIVALPDRVIADDAMFSDEVRAGLQDIARADPHFDPTEFLAGAKTAFRMIVDAFAQGDLDALEPLLSADVYRGFASAVEDRADKGHVLETELVNIKSAQVVEAALKGGAASITVKFVSEQTNVTRDEDGEVVEGDPHYVAEITDLWTFQRDTGSDDPNWALTATAIPS